MDRIVSINVISDNCRVIVGSLHTETPTSLPTISSSVLSTEFGEVCVPVKYPADLGKGVAEHPCPRYYPIVNVDQLENCLRSNGIIGATDTVANEAGNLYLTQQPIWDDTIYHDE